jgi:hypothetical protein
LPSAQPGGTRQRNSGFFLKKFFAEYPQSGHSAKKLIFLFKKFFAECSAGGHSAKLGILLGQMVTLPSVIFPALGKVTRTDLFI